MGERDQKGIPVGTHCEWCGADYDRGAATPAPRTAAAPAPPQPVGAEPPTHCEWCGAEYPVPGVDAT